MSNKASHRIITLLFFLALVISGYLISDIWKMSFAAAIFIVVCGVFLNGIVIMLEDAIAEKNETIAGAGSSVKRGLGLTSMASNKVFITVFLVSSMFVMGIFYEVIIKQSLDGWRALMAMAFLMLGISGFSSLLALKIIKKSKLIAVCFSSIVSSAISFGMLALIDG